MLVLGEDVPDVEDTTPEELQRRAEELRRRAEEAEREIADRRRRAEAEIAEQRRQAERELRQQQLELDHAERELDRRRRHATRVSISSHRTSSSGRSRSSRRSGSSDERVSPLRRMVGAWWLAPIAATFGLGYMIATLFLPPEPREWQLNQLAHDEGAFREWRQITLQVDEDFGRHLAGQEIERIDGQPASLAMAREAPSDLGSLTETRVGRMEELMSSVVEQEASTLRTLTAWDETRGRADSTSSDYQVRQQVEQLVEDAKTRQISAGLGIVSFSVILALCLGGSAWLSAALAGLAVALSAGLFAVGPTLVSVGAARDDYVQSMRDAGSVLDTVRLDLRTAYELEAADRGDDHWTSVPVLLSLPEGVDAQGYLQARQALGEAVEDGDQAEVFAAGVTLTQAAQDLFEDAVAPVPEHRAQLLEAASRDQDAPLPAVLAIGAAVAGYAGSVGLVLGARRPGKGD